MSTALLATSACALACAALVACEVTGRRRGRYVTKPLASLAFVLVPVLAGAPIGERPLATWIQIGLVLGAIGDVLLIPSSKRTFMAGLGVFLLGHVAYVVGFATVVGPAQWPAAAGPLALVPLVVGAVALRWLWPHLGRMRGPVIAYVVVIVTMVVAAIAVARAGTLPDATRTRLVVGAILFFASDLAVARDRFVAPGPTNKAWGLPAYYAGQLLIAWAAIP